MSWCVRVVHVSHVNHIKMSNHLLAQPPHHAMPRQHTADTHPCASHQVRLWPAILNTAHLNNLFVITQRVSLCRSFLGQSLFQHPAASLSQPGCHQHASHSSPQACRNDAASAVTVMRRTILMACLAWCATDGVGTVQPASPSYHSSDCAEQSSGRAALK